MRVLDIDVSTLPLRSEQLAIYPWDDWLTGRLTEITQYEDFQSATETIIRLIRKRARQRNLHVALNKSFNANAIAVLTFVAVPMGQPLPMIPRAKRTEALHKVQENFPICTQCGALLSAKANQYGYTECWTSERGFIHGAIAN